MQPNEGQVIARKYTLQKLIGRGGSGSVWKAHHDALATSIAIKLIPKGATDEVVIRFYKEAQATAQLRSPNVVHVSDCGIENDYMFIVMEYLEGEDLRARLDRLHHFGRDEALRIVRQLTRVLRKAHAAGIVHRDLKPGNIFVCRHEELEIIKILDFGIAKTLFEQAITAPGAIVGTPAYMSPEQALGSGSLDHRADIWALGVISYRMLTGVLPFRGTCGVRTLEAVLRGDFLPPSHHIPDFGQEVDDFFKRAFAPGLKDRFQDVTQFTEAFSTALGLNAHSTSSPNGFEWATPTPSEPQPSIKQRPKLVSKIRKLGPLSGELLIVMLVTLITVILLVSWWKGARETVHGSAAARMGVCSFDIHIVAPGSIARFDARPLPPVRL